MKTKTLISLLALVMFAAASYADTGEQNVMGMVKAISENMVTVQTIGNSPKSVMIAVLPATRFIKDSAAASLNDLKIGDHLVANVKAHDNKLEATQIVFGKVFEHMDMHHHGS